MEALQVIKIIITDTELDVTVEGVTTDIDFDLPQRMAVDHITMKCQDLITELYYRTSSTLFNPPVAEG